MVFMGEIGLYFRESYQWLLKPTNVRALHRKNIYKILGDGKYFSLLKVEIFKRFHKLYFHYIPLYCVCFECWFTKTGTAKRPQAQYERMKKLKYQRKSCDLIQRKPIHPTKHFTFPVDSNIFSFI